MTSVPVERRDFGVFAQRLKREAGESNAAQVRLALRLALCRTPTESEIIRGVTFMNGLKQKYNATDETTLAQLALLVLSLNEFAYLD